MSLSNGSVNPYLQRARVAGLRGVGAPSVPAGCAFLRRPHIVLTRDQMLDITRGRAAGSFDRAIDVQVGRLRRKIEADPKNPSLIKTVRGGYVLASAVESR